MGRIDKNTDFPKFDTLIRTKQGEALLSHIYATHWQWLSNNDNETRKENISIRLRPMYDIFKGGAGSYGQDPEKRMDQYESQYTIGHDMGIWIDSDLRLSKYALEVAENRITVREYISRVFLNLFTYVNDEYTHILYEICKYSEDNRIEAISVDNIINTFTDNPKDSFNQHARIIRNYLATTSFFDLDEEDSLIFVNGYTATKVKDLCNLKYKDKDGKETRDKFKNNKTYANYVGQPIAYDSSTYEDIDKSDDIETKEEDDIYASKIESNLIDFNIQKLIYGPPGTGKSYSITDEVRKSYPNFDLKTDNPFIFRTTFHPEYTYNDFVGQVMPVVKGETITYDFTPGIFTQALKRAITYTDNDVYLILEEMSRANVAAIFGDIFQLLDREDGVSEYRINNDLISKEISNNKQKIYLPSNLHIIGTVNTSDQNVYVMDTAFKRRFDLDYMDLDPVYSEDGSKPLNDYKITFRGSQDEVIESSWIEFYQKFNDFIITSLNLSEDKQLGQFFIKFTNDENINKQLIYGKLLQYIWQDIHLVSFSNKSLFNTNYNSFSKTYKKLKTSLEFDNSISVFSDEFIKTLDGYKGQSNNDL